MDPWSKVDYSRFIREASMVVESSRRWFLAPAGCREDGSWCSRSWKRGGGGTEERSRKRVLSERVSGREGYIGEGLGGGRARWPPGPPLAPLWPHLGSSRSFLYADFSYIFPGIVLAL